MSEQEATTAGKPAQLICIACKSGIMPAGARQKPRRVTIGEQPSMHLNIWSFLKDFIGKDLSRVSMPVTFNEPLSMLQKLVEELETSELLDKAAASLDQFEQMAYVAAFTASTFASLRFRTTKPFNPLLGETYELDRTGEPEGYRAFCEQGMLLDSFLSCFLSFLTFISRVPFCFELIHPAI